MRVVLSPNAYIPSYAHEADAGADLRSPVDMVIPAHGAAFIDTGIHIELPENTVGILKSKSGLCAKHGITTEGGVIDVGYTGSIGVTLHNQTNPAARVQRGDKITQLLIIPVFHVPFELVEELGETERGAKGFGSTGR